MENHWISAVKADSPAPASDRASGRDVYKRQESGRRIADSIYERHQLLSQFLATLGVSEDIAAQDACRIEHVISEETFEKLKEFSSEHLK